MKVLLFSTAPGGAEVLAPVYRLLRASGDFDVTLTGRGYAIDRFKIHGLAAEDVAPIIKGDGGLLARHAPDIAVTSATNIPHIDSSEVDFWHNCKAAGVPVLAMLDQWQNYSLRFYGDGRPDPEILPDYINCIDAIGEAEMLAEGFSPDRLVRFGQPYLAGIKDLARNADRRAIRAGLGIGEDEVVLLFVSEAIAEYYGKSWGFDQFDAAEMFLDMARTRGAGVRVLIKLHPKDDRRKFEGLARRFAGAALTFLDDGYRAVDCILAADEIFGMTSIMLIEAFILGRPVVSIQPNQTGENRLVLARTGEVRTVRSAADGFHPLANGPAPAMAIDYDFKSDELIAFLIEIGGGNQP